MTLMLVLLFPFTWVSAAAQQDEKGTAAQEKVQDQEEASSEAADQEETREEETIESVMAEFNAAMQDFMKEYRTAKTAEERAKMVQESLPKPDAYAARMMPLIEQEADSDAAGAALVWIVQRAQGEITDKASSLLLEHHSDSDQIINVAMTKMRQPPSEANLGFLNKLIEKAGDENERLKGVANYAKIMSMQSGRDMYTRMKDQLDALMAAESEEHPGVVQTKAAIENYLSTLSEETAGFMKSGAFADGTGLEEALESIVETYGDVVLMERGDMVRTIADECEGMLFEMRYLSIGKTAPDIEGEDLDGEEFKLSDYRGKVVVIDFWGDW